MSGSLVRDGEKVFGSQIRALLPSTASCWHPATALILMISSPQPAVIESETMNHQMHLLCWLDLLVSWKNSAAKDKGQDDKNFLLAASNDPVHEKIGILLVPVVRGLLWPPSTEQCYVLRNVFSSSHEQSHSRGRFPVPSRQGHSWDKYDSAGEYPWRNKSGQSLSTWVLHWPTLYWLSCQEWKGLTLSN